MGGCTVARLHGCTLLCAQTRGWADIWNIAAFPRNSAHVYIITTYNRILHTNTPTQYCWQLWSSRLPVATLRLSSLAPYAYHKAMPGTKVRVTVCNRLQRHTIATPAAVVVEEILLDMFLEKYEESAGTFWWRTTQLHAKLQTSEAATVTFRYCISTYITSFSV